MPRLQLRDTEDARQLLMDQQVQGAAFLIPTASSVKPGLYGPGPIPACRYMTGWLAACLHEPNAAVLMVGLGSGAGAIGCLAEFPVDITVVEIDPEVIALARNGFPLIEHYENQGRLHIVCSSAEDYLAETTDEWDIGMCDAYTGEDAIVESVVVPTIQHAKTFWCNRIGTLDDSGQKRIALYLAEAGKPLTGVFAASGLRDIHAQHVVQNWVLTNQELDLEKLDSYQPFQDSETPAAEWLDAAFRDVIRRNWVLEPADLGSMLLA